MTRLLQEQVDRLQATVDAVLQHGVTDNQRKAIAAELDPDADDGEDQEDDGE